MRYYSGEDFDTLLTIAKLSVSIAEDVAFCPLCERGFHQVSLPCDIEDCLKMHLTDCSKAKDTFSVVV